MILCKFLILSLQLFYDSSDLSPDPPRVANPQNHWVKLTTKMAFSDSAHLHDVRKSRFTVLVWLKLDF